MARNPKPASTEDVRQWGRDNDFQVGDRGRLSSELIAEFDRAHKRNNIKYVPGTSVSVFADEAPQAAAPAAKAAPAQRQTTSQPARRESVSVMDGGGDEVEATRELVAALTSAGNAGKSKGRPILLTARTIAYV